MKNNTTLNGLRSIIRSKSGNNLLILTFHRVLKFPDDVIGDVHEEMFEMKLQILSKYFNLLKVSEAIELLKNDSLPSRAVCITFDDGYLDNHDTALPLLKKWAVPATFFVATGYLHGKNMWNDIVLDAFRLTSMAECDLSELGCELDIEKLDLSSTQLRKQAAYAVLNVWKYKSIDERDDNAKKLLNLLDVKSTKRLMMNEKEVRNLANEGMEIGAHTVNHPILRSITNEDSKLEIYESKQTLERIIEKRITSFAYPNGKKQQDYSAEHVDIIKQLGFDNAVTTNWGKAGNGSSQFELPRVAFNEMQSWKFGLKMMKAYFQ